MARLLQCTFVPACAVLALNVTHAETWAFEALIGDAYNFHSSTRIEHEATGRRHWDGNYETRGLEGPLHYAWRIARWRDDAAWELQLLHHKLYLQDPQPPIEALSVSHGFNIITINRAMRFGPWRARVGVGPVVTHAEARIAGTSYDGPYELAGAAFLVGGGREVRLTEHLYALGEFSATYGHVEAQPKGTPRLELSISNPALHAHIGLGYRF